MKRETKIVPIAELPDKKGDFLSSYATAYAQNAPEKAFEHMLFGAPSQLTDSFDSGFHHQATSEKTATSPIFDYYLIITTHDD